MRSITIIVAAFLALQNITACSLRQRATETPVPNEQNIEKTFFSGSELKGKRFLVGWAPEGYQGPIAEELVTFMAQESVHLNVEFEVTEKSLIGRAVNPSFPNDRSKWEPVITIPISSHYYFEHAKDQYGRDTNEYIENTSRSHWSRRPLMKLDLSQISINKMAFALLPVVNSIHQYSVKSVSDVEWDKDKSFLGFSMNVSHMYYGSDLSITYRFNFMEFDSDQNFKGTPYHQDNSRFFNALHSVSYKVEDGGTLDKQIMKVARWDFSKPQDIYLNNVPTKYIPLFRQAIEDWEKVFIKIGAVAPGKKAFIIHDTFPGKHHFDLRYPSIYWHDDKRYSYNQGTLGIALNNVDVMNGKMIAGNVIVYGGALEHYVNRNVDLNTGDSKGNNSFNFVSEKLLPNIPFQSMHAADYVRQRSSQITDVLSQQVLQRLNADRQRLDQAQQSGLPQAVVDDLKKSLEQQFQNLNFNGSTSAKISDMIKQLPNIKFDATEGLTSLSQEDMIVARESQKSLKEKFNFSFLPEAQNSHSFFAEESKKRALVKKELWGHSSMISESMGLDRIVPAAQAAMADDQRPYNEVVQAAIKEILIHELGHFMGLGHQFKGNIVPEEGTVPSIYTRAEKNRTTPGTLYYKAQEANRFTNLTSVMEYPSGRTVMAIAADKHVPGPHDELVLRYLYKGEVPFYNQSKDQFDFVTLEQMGEQFRGRIPEKWQGKRVSYFPACNDYDASLNKDPYCNRWDAGTSAQDIVKSYSREINDNIVNMLFNLTDDSPTSAYRAEWYVMFRTFDMYSHIRPFYDQLRIALRTMPDAEKNYWDRLRTDEAAMFEFSSACRAKGDQEIQSPLLKEILHNEKIKELCQASLETLDLMSKYLSLPPVDFSRINEENRYIHGGYIAGDGEPQWDKYIGGRWYELSNIGIKIATLFNLTSTTPLMIFGGGLVENPFYDYAENRNLYRTLFPKEVTQMVSTTLEKNLRFGTLDPDGKTVLGAAASAMGYFSLLMNYGENTGNEDTRLTDNYLDILKSTTEFDLGIAAVIVKATRPTAGDPNLVKQFSGEVFDLSTMKSTPVRDVYILPNGRLIVRANQMFLFPVTKLRFYRDEEAYVLVYKVQYDDQRRNDPFREISAKKALMRLYDQIMDSCVTGTAGSGLSSYFTAGSIATDKANKNTFSGFELWPGISTESGTPSKRYRFEESIDKEFAKYEQYARQQNPNAKYSMAKTCEEALRGAGLIVATSGLLNGYWLNITGNYVER